MRRNATAMLAAALVCGLALAGSEPSASSASEGFDWIGGYWCTTQGEQRIEELWLTGGAGMLLGVGRTTKGDRTVGFEYMRIVLEGDSITFIAQPNGGAPVSFRGTGRGEKWVRFENPQHDFPQRVEYRRTGDRLHAQIAGPGREGKESVISFDYARCAGAN